LKSSIKFAIIIPVLIALVLGITAMAAVVGTMSSNTIGDITHEVIDANVGLYSIEFQSMLQDAYGTVSSVAPLISDAVDESEAREITDPRAYVVNMITDVLAANESFLGIWTGWEPDAFDGQDSSYAGAPYHDGTGRFIPYVVNVDGGVEVTALVDYDDPVAGEYYQAAKNSGKPYITDPFPYEIAGKETLVCTIAVPVMRDGRVAGVVGIDLNLEGFTEMMNASHILGDGYRVVLSPGGLVASHPDPQYIMLPYTEIGWMKQFEAQFQEIFQNGGVLTGQTYSDVISADMDFQLQGIDVAGTGRNWIILGVVPDTTVTAASSQLLWVIVLIGVALFVVITVITYIIIRRSLAPLTPLSDWILQAGETGNLHYTDEDWALCDKLAKSTNEIGRSVNAYGKMMRKFAHYGEILETLADHDLTVEVTTMGPKDTFGNALISVVTNLNGTFGEIGASSEQVSTGSGQVADSAQALAAGSTQQAASIQQLSTSITDISEKTRINTEKAGKAAALAGSIKANAEKGSRQMDDMMDAEKKINDSSQAIGKVIKTIDDIAFQTNILALNAAVEAARAGQHGKGFAVVADEVRSLAAKSADAAKNTESLIADSMAKAEQGVRIAEGTFASLSEIVSGINESSVLVTEIADASEAQAVNIAQINTGIDQVAQIVQQNSAMAEESAAASQEMSGQSVILQQLISQFRLKDSRKEY
jgi:methyl-accepting chemotaxis protein